MIARYAAKTKRAASLFRSSCNLVPSSGGSSAPVPMNDCTTSALRIHMSHLFRCLQKYVLFCITELSGVDKILGEKLKVVSHIIECSGRLDL